VDKKIMDFVYLVKNDPENDSEELRYSLRSLKNIPHATVFLVGEKPDWVTNIVFIPVEQSENKYQSVRKSIETAIANDAISDDFVIMNDDFFIMKPMTEITVTNFGTIRSVIEKYHQRYPDASPYTDSMKQMYTLLLRKGFSDPLSYELHMPMLMNKGKLRQLYKEVTSSLDHYRSYYGNYFHIGGVTVTDTKIFIDPTHNDPLYQQDPDLYLNQQLFLSSTGGSFKRGPAGLCTLPVP
jgi:hypothetical protein